MPEISPELARREPDNQVIYPCSCVIEFVRNDDPTYGVAFGLGPARTCRQPKQERGRCYREHKLQYTIFHLCAFWCLYRSESGFGINVTPLPRYEQQPLARVGAQWRGSPG